MVFGEAIPFEHVRDTLAGMGQSAVIVGDDTMVKVHIHTENPGEVLQYALTLGYLDQIKIDNMSRQTEALTEQRDAAREHAAPVAPEMIGEIAVIAVASGDGIAAALQAMGATGLVPGGQTMNPSTQDLLAAVEASGTDQVVILPNNRNIIMAANQVPELTDRTVRIVPTKSIPHALAALAAFNPHQAIDDNVSAMTDALETVTSIEITRAVRDVELNGVQISQGQVIGLIDNELVASTDSVAATAAILFGMADREAELVTVFTGVDATDGDLAAIENAASTTWPDAEVDTQDGGQPHYLFVISIE
jgi:DAK2 domain fusion protein YloV